MRKFWVLVGVSVFGESLVCFELAGGAGPAPAGGRQTAKHLDRTRMFRIAVGLGQVCLHDQPVTILDQQIPESSS